MLCVFFVLFYWFRKVKFRFNRYPLIVSVLPVLLTGAFAGLVFHAFRNDKVWNSIDMMSAFYGVVMTCIYLWYRVSGGWLQAFCFTLLFPFCLRLFLESVSVPAKMTSSVIFTAMAVALLLPAMIYCFRNKFKYIGLLAGASAFFTAAMVFRELDLPVKPYFSHGTHFLWHLSASAALFLFIHYIYMLDEERAADSRHIRKKHPFSQ
jgi:hypothetical protein